MKLIMNALLVCASLGMAGKSNAQTTVGVDPTQSWIGYMNVFELPANGGAYDFGSAWGTADLNASYTGPVLTLTPNTSIDRDVPNDSYWWVGGAGGAPNKTMDASMYVQNDSLAGQTVVFVGDTLSDTLISPYTSMAFIKDFAPDYSSYTEDSISLVGGNAFSLSLATTAGSHVQYGFETIGPDARLATVGALGNVSITAAPVPEPSTLALAGLCSAAAMGFIRRRK